MDQRTLDRLRALPPLAAATVRAQARPCKVCRAPSPPFDVVDFNKCCSEQDPFAFGFAGIAVTYFRCRRCGLLFTDFFDDWSADDFRSFIYNADYVKADGAYVAERPRALAALVARKAGVARDARVLDFGSGAGAFAQSLRDHGFTNVTDYDPFSSPARPAGRFDLVTCFEVIEHTTTPDATLRDISSLLADGGCVLLTTGIQPDDIETRRVSWWYVGPRNGHASIFTWDALALLARSCGLVLNTGGEMPAFNRRRAFRSHPIDPRGRRAAVRIRLPFGAPPTGRTRRAGTGAKVRERRRSAGRQARRSHGSAAWPLRGGRAA